MSGDRLEPRPAGDRWAFLRRWLLIGQLAFSQLGSRATSPEHPTSAWVQMLPDEPDGWHPLERLGAGTVLTVDYRPDEGRAWQGRCPN